MRYIGQTVNTFNRRYSGGKWWKTSDNIYLKNAANKYGHDGFIVEVLLDGISSKTELNFWEQEYIRVFGSLYPKGYNMNAGGIQDSLLQLSKDRISKAKLEGRVLELLNNRSLIVYRFGNLTSFSNHFDLSVPKVSEVIAGHRSKTAGWSLPSRPLKHIVLIDPNGIEYDILDWEVKPFCRSRNLKPEYIYYLSSGHVSQYKGWKLKRNYFPEVNVLPKMILEENR